MKVDRREQLQSPRPLRTFLQDPNPVKVALWFKVSDAPRLWDLASRHYPEDPEDASWFAKAARCAQGGIPALLECSTRAQVEEAVAWLIRIGITPPRVEDVRL